MTTLYATKPKITSIPNCHTRCEVDLTYAACKDISHIHRVLMMPSTLPLERNRGLINTLLLFCCCRFQAKRLKFVTKYKFEGKVTWLLIIALITTCVTANVIRSVV